MRGEETQLLGAVTQGFENGWFVLPGTHSKWVLLERGQVKQLRTYMTGELFDVLRKQGTIAAAIGAGSPGGVGGDATTVKVPSGAGTPLRLPKALRHPLTVRSAIYFLACAPVWFAVTYRPAAPVPISAVC